MKKLFGLFILIILCLSCGTTEVKIPDNVTPQCRAYYSTLIIIGQSDQGFITSGKKDFGLAGVWVLPCNTSMTARDTREAKERAQELKLKKIERCKKVYFKDGIVSTEDPAIYLKYTQCLQ